jgi:hypothetical protein
MHVHNLYKDVRIWRNIKWNMECLVVIVFHNQYKMWAQRNTKWNLESLIIIHFSTISTRCDHEQRANFFHNAWSWTQIKKTFSTIEPWSFYCHNFLTTCTFLLYKIHLLSTLLSIFCAFKNWPSHVYTHHFALLFLNCCALGESLFFWNQLISSDLKRFCSIPLSFLRPTKSLPDC